MTSAQVLRILEVTDSLNLNREAIHIPLSTSNDGEVTLLPDGRLKIVASSKMPFEEWLTRLRIQLTQMDLSRLKRN